MSSSPSLAERFRAACRDTPPSNNSPPLQQHLSDALQQLHPLIHLPPVQSPLQPSPTPRQLLAQRATVQPDPQLSSLTWANSRSRQVLRDFAHECGSQRDQPSDPSSNPPHPSAPASSPIDPVLWAAQEHAAASAVLRDIRALHLRRKAAPPLLSARRLKPEAAAEMARARVAAAAAAAVMKEHAASSTVLTSADTPQAARPRFRRSLSQANRHKKHVHFADDTVFKPTPTNRLP